MFDCVGYYFQSYFTYEFIKWVVVKLFKKSRNSHFI